MNGMLVKSVISTLLLITVAACSSQPTHLIVAPEIYLPASHQFINKEAKVEVVDMRTSTHIVQILEEDEAAIILSSEERIEDIIKKSLSKQWRRKGLKLTKNAKNDITVMIEKAVVSVTQESVTYNAQIEILLKVSVDNGKQTLTNTFKNRAYSEGALSADVAVLEREFNQHLSILLKQVLNSKDIKNFL